jgi:hypothetical protein
VGENFLADPRVELSEIPCSCIERNVVLVDLDKAEAMKNFGNRKQFADFQLQIARKFRQVRLAVVGRCCNGLDQTSNHVGRNRRQSVAELQLGQMLGRSGLGLGPSSWRHHAQRRARRVFGQVDRIERNDRFLNCREGANVS